MSNPTDKLNEAVEQLTYLANLQQIDVMMRRDSILIILTALAELREDRRKRDAEVLRWAAMGIAFRGENLKPYPRGAVRNVAKLMLDHANLVERGEIVVNKEREG